MDILSDVLNIRIMNQNSTLDIFAGIATVFVVNTVVAVSAFMLGWSLQQMLVVSTVLVYGSFCIGIVQLIYVIPLCVRLRRRGRFDTMKGVVIGAVITMLLTGSCFLFVVRSVTSPL